jgi:hypothetical protein
MLQFRKAHVESLVWQPVGLLENGRAFGVGAMQKVSGKRLLKEILRSPSFLVFGHHEVNSSASFHVPFLDVTYHHKLKSHVTRDRNL